MSIEYRCAAGHVSSAPGFCRVPKDVESFCDTCHGDEGLLLPETVFVAGQGENFHRHRDGQPLGRIVTETAFCSLRLFPDGTGPGS